jgi:predicted Zn finger-like uncharacterized protein
VTLFYSYVCPDCGAYHASVTAAPLGGEDAGKQVKCSSCGNVETITPPATDSRERGVQ